MISANSNGYFITGSDTDVGKTFVASQLITQLVNLGITVETRKPAESGWSDSEASDARLLQKANRDRESLQLITPNRFVAALAPHRAARLEGRKLDLSMLVAACKKIDNSSLLVAEGAGGFYSPIADDGLNADLASALDLEVIIVVDDRIGAVNQSLMTIAAVQSRGLTIAAVVLNQVGNDNETGMDNRSDLQQYTDLPVFCCPHRGLLEPVFGGGNS